MAILTDYCALTRRPRSALSAALAALVVAVGALFLSPLGYAHAQVAPTVTDGGVTNEFPDGMTFSVSADSDSEIERVRLRYEIQPDGTSAIGEADFEPGTSVNGTFVLEGNNPPKIYLPPGTVIDYYWEVTDADGDTAVTAPQTFFYDDSRFSWSKVEGDGVTIYYYSGSDSDAQAMHDVAKESLAEMSALLGTEIPFDVQVWTYQDTNDMKPALSRRSETYESQVTTAGVRVASDTVLVLGNVSFDTLRHELTHVVTAEAGESAFGTLPAWLDEGTAVYGQNDPGGFRDAVERAIARGNVLSVKEISAYPGDPNKVGLFYGQGWALVSYLVDTYGQEQFAQLFAAVKDGKRIDRALDAVYGFDQDGLEDQWREANDLPPRVTAAPDAQETDAPSQASAGDDDGGTSPALIIALIVGLLALAGAIGFAGITLARRL